ncbi:DUF2064 domain-containing protein [Portibacter marinus]|uniref:DUF2064 domain-containing protein n=1 Tax=Portibacter marinus TaxID=2898660 RepID=UPI001F20B0E8|nr:DUF2064 domain-containing protein [Portibacter marinus]
MDKSNSTALIYFSRSVKCEAESKSWSNFSTRAQRIAISKFLYRKTLSVLRSSELDIIFFDEQKQVGNSFGEKLVNAFRHAFDLGYQSAFSVGNDCLSLEHIDFGHIKSTLESGTAILGPTFRQGAYLIGLKRDQLDDKKFQCIRWQSEYTASDLKTYFEVQSIELEVLEQKRDINQLKDFALVVKELKDISSIAIIRTFLAFVKNSLPVSIHLIAIPIVVYTPFLRGPPSHF